ncbi:MAG: hypothetical protein RML12_01545 [Xanthomonadales bacterium]|nr:hypothetical protein [Xanthomonadales bacterium]
MRAARCFVPLRSLDRILSPRLKAILSGVGLALLAVLGLWQWLADRSARTLAEGLRTERTVIAARIARQLEAWRGELAEGAERALVAGGDATASRSEARRRLGEEVLSVEVFSPELRELMEQDLSAFGFARANLLLEARQGRAAVQVVERERRRGLALAVRVPREGEASALVLCEMPVKAISRLLREQLRRAATSACAPATGRRSCFPRSGTSVSRTGDLPGNGPGSRHDPQAGLGAAALDRLARRERGAMAGGAGPAGGGARPSRPPRSAAPPGKARARSRAHPRRGARADAAGAGGIARGAARPRVD